MKRRFLPHKARGQTALSSVQRQFLLVCVVPLALAVLLLIAGMASYSMRYKSILHNVTAASAFNQEFKSNIDLQTYYFTVDSLYSTGLPIEQVREAQDLARELQKTTTSPESLKAITSVLSLSENLENKLYDIAEAETYDERQRQLEDNVYILTDLIQEYMYTYLYHESVQLNTLQTQMERSVRMEIGAILVGLGLLAWLLLRYVNRVTHALTDPIAELSRQVERIGQGDWDAEPGAPANVRELRALQDGVTQMADQLQDLIEKNRQEQISLRRTELALLQSQINPHFLYNTLDTIIWLIEIGQYDEAEEMVKNLSLYFRTSLSKGRDIVTLGEEERHVRSYMQIQQLRYRDILTCEIDIDPALADCLIPKLSLQPLVENSLYHGIKQKRGKGHIAVTGVAAGGDIVLTVRDNGIGMTAERLAQIRAALASGERVGFGLAAVQERIQLMFGKEYGLTIDSNGDGTAVTVRIPQKREASE